MKILFHAIAIEPARWTSERVSRPLTELLGPVEQAGFRELEVDEPHLGAKAASSDILEAGFPMRSGMLHLHGTGSPGGCRNSRVSLAPLHGS